MFICEVEGDRVLKRGQKYRVERLEGTWSCVRAQASDFPGRQEGLLFSWNGGKRKGPGAEQIFIGGDGGSWESSLDGLVSILSAKNSECLYLWEKFCEDIKTTTTTTTNHSHLNSCTYEEAPGHIIVGTYKVVISNMKGRWGKAVSDWMSKVDETKGL